LSLPATNEGSYRHPQEGSDPQGKNDSNRSLTPKNGVELAPGFTGMQGPLKKKKPEHFKLHTSNF
jgi:hypothetical protein